MAVELIEVRDAMDGGRAGAPRARLLESAEIARNPSKYGVKYDVRRVDVNGCKVKTTNSCLTLRR